MSAVIEDEAVAEPVEEEVNEIDESVDTEEVDDETESEAAESEVKGEAEEEAEPSESSTEKKDDGFQKRIDELTKRFYEEKQRGDQLQRQWEESRPKVEPEAPGKTLADFDYDEGKFSEYVKGQAVIEAQKAAQTANAQQAAQRRRAEFQAKEAKFAGTVDDYEQVAHHSPIKGHVANIVMGAEKAPELAYYLGKNPEIAMKISDMHPIDAARQLGIIEATKLVKPEPPKPKAPKAVPKIKGSDTGSNRIRSDSPESDKLSADEWKRRELKRIASRNK